MKVEFEVLKATPRVSVLLTRDSVCAGDDADAPHRKTVEMYSFLDPAQFTRELASGYLPSVAGVGHSWTCIVNDIPLARLTIHDVQPLIARAPFAAENRVHFKYHSATF